MVGPRPEVYVEASLLHVGHYERGDCCSSCCHTLGDLYSLGLLLLFEALLLQLAARHLVLWLLPSIWSWVTGLAAGTANLSRVVFCFALK
ncbi:hypothetical protein Taro_016245 [Colocasia esculenta]|uniref:Uncharacterized protein n=1 Tax=Colocasia esculenta TaxID=4460 RepID=A0A843UJU4_COLES|nr:hypothetical protein [Colocasia esculenta]